MPKTSCCVLAVTAALILPIALSAQSNQQPVSFEVASVKPNTSGTQASRSEGLQPGGRFTATNWTLAQLIRMAYRLQPYQLAGGPGWIETARFDIVAKANRSYTSSELPGILRAFLSDRFKLAVHSEPRDLRVYALTVAKRGRVGPRLSVTKVDCAALLAKNDGVPPPPENGKVPPCVSETHAGREFIGHGVTMAQFAQMLSFPTHATVVDETGLNGSFDIELNWLPDTESAPSAGASGSTDSVSIFTAVQEQLGLKLEAKKGPVEVIVIDRVEKPTPD